MKDQNRNRTGLFHGVPTQMSGGVQIESRSDWHGETGAQKYKKLSIWI